MVSTGDRYSEVLIGLICQAKPLLRQWCESGMVSRVGCTHVRDRSALHMMIRFRTGYTVIVLLDVDGTEEFSSILRDVDVLLPDTVLLTHALVSEAGEVKQ